MADFSFDRNIQQESGGHQFDRNGNPLTSSAGAVGVAQVMPGTGPEAARDAGLPWDPVRYRTDANYNRAIGNAYHAKLQRKYNGDVVLADAAYNGGPTRLDNLMAVHGRDGALARMPAETRDYIKKVRGVTIPGASDYSGGTGSHPFFGSTGSMPPDALRTPMVTPLSAATPDANAVLDAAHAAATAPASTQVAAGAAPAPDTTTGAGRFPVVDPFTIGSRISAAAQGQDEALSGQDKFLNTMEETLNQVHNERVARVQEQVQAKEQINQTVQGETQSMIDRVTPFMQRRAHIADQLNKVANMNPLARGILSIFDSNYDPKHLQDKLQQTGEALDSITHDYEYMTNLRERLSGLIDQHAANGQALENVTLANLDEDQKLWATTVNNANEHFATLNGQVQANAGLVEAQHQASDRLITSMAPADIETAMSNAQKSPGGVTVVDGVPLSFGELRQRSIALKDQAMSMRGQEIALEQGEGNLANWHAGKWAETATETQINQAIAANGNYNGMKIPMSTLTQQLAIRQSVTAMQVHDVTSGGQITNLGQEVSSFQNDANVVAARVKSFAGGSVPPELQSAYISMNRSIAEMNQQFLAAKAKGPNVLNDTAGVLRQRNQQLREQFFAAVDKYAETHSGGDKNAAGWISTFIKGGRLDANQSADALYYYTQKGGLPTGMRSSPEAKASFAAAQQAVKDTEADIARRQAGGERFNAQQHKALIMQAIQQSASRAYTAGAFNNITDSLPKLANSIHDPFGQVNPQDWAAAQAQGTAAAYDNLANTLGTNRAGAMAVYNGTYQGPHRDQFMKMMADQKLGPQFVAQQQALTLQALDRSPSAKAGFRPSEALYHFLARPDAIQLANRYENMAGRASFGDFLGTGTGANIAEKFGQWSTSIQQQVIDNRVAHNNKNVRDYATYNVDPFIRAHVILSGMKGFSEPESQKLINALQQVAPDAENPRNMYGGTSDSRDDIAIALRGAKFQDPGLERLRKLAIQQWDETARITDGAMDRIHKGGQ